MCRESELSLCSRRGQGQLRVLVRVNFYVGALGWMGGESGVDVSVFGNSDVLGLPGVCGYWLRRKG